MRPVAIYSPLQTLDLTANHNHVGVVWYISWDINSSGYHLACGISFIKYADLLIFHCII